MSMRPPQNAPSRPSPIQFTPAEPRELRFALELALKELHPAARASLVDSLAKLHAKSLGAFEALLVARQDGAIVGAAWAQPHPGKTATLWTPQAHGVALEQIATGLLREISRLADAAGLSMTQALIENVEAPIVQHLRQSQYRPLARLTYMQRDLSRFDPISPQIDPPTDLEFEVYSENNHQQFKQVTQRTYANSLDCPDLEGRRDQEDVLAGYRATGDFRPDNWRLARLNGEVIGVLLNTDYGDGQSELIYMGLCPEARGRGWGNALVAESIRLANEAGSGRLCVAVDDRNSHAKRTYERHGFSVWASRYAYVRWREGAE